MGCKNIAVSPFGRAESATNCAVQTCLSFFVCQDAHQLRLRLRGITSFVNWQGIRVMPMIAFGVMYEGILKVGLKESHVFSLPYVMPPGNAD